MGITGWPRPDEEEDEWENPGPIAEGVGFVSAIALAAALIGALAIFVDWARERIGMGPLF